MRYNLFGTLGALILVGCGGAKPAESPGSESDGSTAATSSSDSSSDASSDTAEADGTAADDKTFQLKDSDTAGSAHGETESKIQATATEAAMKFFVVDKESNDPIDGIVISLIGPDGKKYFTQETDKAGYAEVLVPVGKDYEIVYLTLGTKDITAKVSVKDAPRQNVKLTLRYKRWVPEPGQKPSGEPVFVLKGVTFDTGKATIRPESFPRLDSVVEYMTYKKGVRIEVSGHTDNVGNPANNKALSQKRAEACRDYLAKKGIDKSRIVAVGYGDERPVASNDSEDGRQQNRRIEAKEL